MKHQIISYFRRIETLRKTQPVHCFASFFKIWFLPQTIMAFYANEKKIFEKTTKEKEEMLVSSIFSLSHIVCLLFCLCLEKKYSKQRGKRKGRKSWGPAFPHFPNCSLYDKNSIFDTCSICGLQLLSFC